MREDELEQGESAVYFSSVGSFKLADTDGSETVVSFSFDLSSLLSDAGISLRLMSLKGADATIDDLVSGYLTGSFVFNTATKQLIVMAEDIRGVALKPELFLDSDQDFGIPVSALVRDTAIINGQRVVDEKVERGTFNVTIRASADVPTAFADSTSGERLQALPLTAGGVTTDTDVALGRVQSEEIYYIVSVAEGEHSDIEYAMLNRDGGVAGLDNHGGHWLLMPSDLDGLHIFMRFGHNATNMTVQFHFTTVAVDDNDIATNSVGFDVTVFAGQGTGLEETRPLAPILMFGENTGVEDETLILDITAIADPKDTTSPTLSVVFSGLPTGAEILGAVRMNPLTDKWIASATDVIEGLVQMKPPKHFSGSLSITVEAVAATSRGMDESSGEQTASIYFDPVADGASLIATPQSSLEDQPIHLNINTTDLDTDGSESLGDFFYVSLSSGASAPLDVGVVGQGDIDAQIDGTTLVGWYRAPIDQLTDFVVQPKSNWHGEMTVEIVVASTETEDDADGNNVKASKLSHKVVIDAKADPPIITAPDRVSGQEDTSIPIMGLTAELADSVTVNGKEVLSVVISGVPSDSVFSSGSNNGDGSWYIPPQDLAALAIKPPPEFAGNFTLNFTALALEISNGDEVGSSLPILIEVEPVADTFLMICENTDLGTSGSAALDLNVRLTDTRGNETSELGPEFVLLTLTGIPDGVFVKANAGGSLAEIGPGSITFTGTEAQSNALSFVSGPNATVGTKQIGVSGVTMDGYSVLDTPVMDSFRLVVTAPTVLGLFATATTAGANLMGGDGNDVLLGTTGAERLVGGAGIDFLIGGAGSDTMTGGDGADVFQWTALDLGAMDTVTDFTVGTGGDQLDFSLLVTTFNRQTSHASEFVRLTAQSGSTVVAIKQGVTWVNVVKLVGVINLDLDQMITSGNILM